MNLELEKNLKELQYAIYIYSKIINSDWEKTDLYNNYREIIQTFERSLNDLNLEIEDCLFFTQELEEMLTGMYFSKSKL